MPAGTLLGMLARRSQRDMCGFLDRLEQGYKLRQDRKQKSKSQEPTENIQRNTKS